MLDKIKKPQNLSFAEKRDKFWNNALMHGKCLFLSLGPHSFHIGNFSWDNPYLLENSFWGFQKSIIKLQIILLFQKAAKIKLQILQFISMWQWKFQLCLSTKHVSRQRKSGM